MKEEYVDDDTLDLIIIETLKFWIRLVKHKGCTREQEIIILNAISENTETQATVEELASFYGVSKDAINGIIKRKYIGRPRRNVVLYSFSKFRKLVPESWRKKRSSSDG